MSFDAKSGILKAINETNDPAMKTVLLLMLGVFEEIGEKIDSVLNNDATIRAMVLNGHEPVHHKHHEWLNDRIARDEEIKVLSSWVRVQMQHEADNKASSRKIKDGVVGTILGWAAIGILGFLVGHFGVIK